jgi:signal transduction histidine kinase
MRTVAISNEILVVEDDRLQAQLLKRLLEQHGHVVRLAANGGQALVCIKEQPPALVISDIVMPVMDGYELCRRIKAKPAWRQLPVILVTALTDAQNILRGLQAGADNFITKPYQREQLLARVQDMLASRRLHGKRGRPAAEVEVVYDGQRMRLSSDRVQILNLLLSSFESAIRQNAELRRTKQALEELTVTLEKKVEERAKTLSAEIAQRQLKDRFLSHVSHELRTPVAAVYQFLSLLLDGLAGELAPEQREYLEMAFRNVNQLKQLIGDLLEVTRVRTGKLRLHQRLLDPYSLLPPAVESFRPAANEHHITLGLETLPDGLPPLVADPARFNQVVANLLTNALKFTPENGRITVTARAVVGDLPGGVCVSVADTGCGMAQEDCARVFDELYQVERNTATSRQGLGLGLFICRELVSQMGGRIWVESAPEQGSTFHFILPGWSFRHRLPQFLAASPPAPGSELAWLEIELQPASDRGRHAAEHFFDQAVEPIQRTLDPLLDLMLPRPVFPPSATNEHLFLLTRRPPAARAALAGAIRSTLKVMPAMGAGGGLTSHVNEIIVSANAAADPMLLAEMLDAWLARRLAEERERHATPQKNLNCG